VKVFFNEPTTARYFRTVFRLSIVVAIVSATVIAYQGYEAWQSENQSYERTVRIMNCAIRLSPQQLASKKNEFGLLDVAPVCGVGSDGKTFWVSVQEIEDHRNDKYMEALELRPPMFDVMRVSTTFFTVFVVVNLIGILLFAAHRTFRWVFK
jgi:hypothetical protein